MKREEIERIGIAKGVLDPVRVGSKVRVFAAEANTAEIIEFAEAIAAAAIAAAPAVPHGWQIVPIHPDSDMCVAGQWKAREWARFPLRIAPIYQAMLAAAPKATIA
jgi:hypothetical protein